MKIAHLGNQALVGKGAGVPESPLSSDSSFERLLAPGISAPKSPQELSQKTFGFGELGIFGRYGQQEVMAQSTRSRSNPDGDRLTGKASPRTPDSKSGLPQIYEGSDTEHESATASSESFRIRPAPPQITIAGIMPSVSYCDAKLGPLEQVDAIDAPAGRDGMVSKNCVRVANARLADISVSVSGPGEAINIVARSPVGSGSYSGLQKKLEDVAAEFGVKVSEFRLNGHQQAVTSTVGDNDGRRTR